MERLSGTGFIISSTGYVLTNRHVIRSDEEADETKIVGAVASRKVPASELIPIGSNEHDVALLKFADTSRTYNAVQLGRPAAIKVGTYLCSEGFPADKEFFFADGKVSGTGAERGFWFTQMPSNPGDSGAPSVSSVGRGSGDKGRRVRRPTKC